MVLTPRFSITQDDSSIYISIRVPYIRVSDAELIAEGSDFYFHCKPYLLKLQFPYEFKQDEDACKATYDPNLDNGTIKAQLTKLLPGQHFPDLDLPSKLLIVRRSGSSTSLLTPTTSATHSSALPNSKIEVLSSNDIDNKDPTNDNYDSDAHSTATTAAIISLSHCCGYGFNRNYRGIFADLRDEMIGVLEIADPENSSPQQRRIARIATENSSFSAERYLGDWLYGPQDPLYISAMAFEPFWIQQWQYRSTISSNIISAATTTATIDTVAAAATDTSTTAATTAITSSTSNVISDATSQQQQQQLPPSLFARSDAAFDAVVRFTEKETDTLATKLGAREYLIDKSSSAEWRLLCGLADVLFAFCYDIRITEGDSNVESAHNICRLSALLSWLDDYDSSTTTTAAAATADSKVTVAAGSDSHQQQQESKLAEAEAETAVEASILFSLRRSVVYPYLRCWKLSRKLLADVAKILFLGKRTILKCFLQLHRIFEHTDTHYLLNKIFITDYCIWIQRYLSDDSLMMFAKVYNRIKSSIESSSHQGKERMGFCLPALEQWGYQQLTTVVVTNDDDEADSASNAVSAASAINDLPVPQHLRDYSSDQTAAMPALRYLSVVESLLECTTAAADTNVGVGEQPTAASYALVQRLLDDTAKAASSTVSLASTTTTTTTVEGAGSKVHSSSNALIEELSEGFSTAVIVDGGATKSSPLLDADACGGKVTNLDSSIAPNNNSRYNSEDSDSRNSDDSDSDASDNSESDSDRSVGDYDGDGNSSSDCCSKSNSEELD